MSCGLWCHTCCVVPVPVLCLGLCLVHSACVLFNMNRVRVQPMFHSTTTGHITISLPRQLMPPLCSQLIRHSYSEPGTGPGTGQVQAPHSRYDITTHRTWPQLGQWCIPRSWNFLWVVPQPKIELVDVFSHTPKNQSVQVNDEAVLTQAKGMTG
jgi:hypothetical protein